MSSNVLADLLEGKIDFVGQNLVEQIAKTVLIAGAVVSFIAGFAAQNLRVTFGLYAVIVLILAVVVLPPWPMFNQHPVKWLPAASSPSDSKSSK
ncbi:microsomal signal peptidase 12 kDa subunit [Coprinopsis marcescibilis]|uniref:Signal peptidase complex subunit 1 n=1 Tax=Coprinopsis marcescibilis TaxID=230819 RepID=A0A5C3L3X9_COPMA|nr:microsomal signal peptidase 12 kDa subunit [Coprinopsis marcescibilis]